MSTGIVCKVWNIHGNTKTKNIKAQLGDSISYILDEEKTNSVLSLNDAAISDPKAQLDRECRYIENDIKTMAGAYVGGINVLSTNVKDAVKEMIDVKEFYGKTDGRAALHGMISLPEEESSIENASKLMQLCEDVLKELFPNHQAIFAIHANTDNLHVHFIVNSVGLNGKKIHQDKDFIKKVVHPCINKYAARYGFSENEEWKKEVSSVTSFAETKIELRKIVDLAIEQSDSMDDFIGFMKQSGIQINVGEHISLKMDGMSKAIRTYQLGVNYSKDAIVERIATRKAAFDSISVVNQVTPINVNDIYTPELIKVKRYREMDMEERERVVKLLRVGRNPWKEQHEMNWQLNQIAKELNSINRVSELISFYSKDGTIAGALEGILEAKEKVAKEKKIIRGQKQTYKPILDIYDEMKKIERKAYLYEHEFKMEFRPEYERYRELTRRLKHGYDKGIDEVANFVNECEERLLYAHAQLNELSAQYREIKKYEKSRGTSLNASGKLYDLLDLQEMNASSQRGVFETNVSYIVSDSSNAMLRVTKLPDIDEHGHVKEVMNITVLTRYGEKIEEFDSAADLAQFRKKIFEYEKQYGFGDCRKFGNISAARDFLRNIDELSSDKTTFDSLDKTWPVDEKSSHSHITLDQEQTGYTFTQAINLKSVKDADGIHYIANRNNPSFIAIVMSNESNINIRVINKDGEIIREEQLPPLKGRTSGGYLTIVKLQEEYGFSDDMVAFDNLDEARQHVDEKLPTSVDRKKGLNHEQISL